MAIQINQPKAKVMQEGADLKGIRNPRLPVMASAPQAPERAQGEQMPASPSNKAPAGGATMSAFDPKAAAEQKPAPKKLGDMKAHPETNTVQTAGQSYLRLRMRVTGDKLSVVDVQEVQGPLVQSTSVAGEYAYEVQLDSRPLAAEGILDVGTSRSFPRPGTDEHYITHRSSFEFNVRVPRAAIPDQAVPRLSITVYRFEDVSPKTIQGRISAQSGLQATPVAQLQNLQVETLDPALREKFQKVFPKLTVPRK